jgi:hypothetical protein
MSTPEERKILCAAWRAKNKKRINQYSHRTHRRYKQEALVIYGKVCWCCKESNPDFLSFDHINNDGAAHRKKYGRSLARWAKVAGFPPVLRTLCYNCNLGRAHAGLGGICPHQHQPIEGVHQITA